MRWLLTGSHWLIVAGGYLLGSLLGAPWIGRREGIDIRALGSGNPGFSNLRRQVGWGRAWPALLWDLAKGSGAAAGGYWLGQEAGAQWGVLAAVIGHCYPLPRFWRGGKGVSPFLGGMLVLDWPAALAGLAGWLTLAKLVKISSVASLTAVAGVVVVCWIRDSAATETGLLAAAIIVVRHRANFTRLAHGTEPEL